MRHHLDSTKKKFIGRRIISVERIRTNAVVVYFEDWEKVEISIWGKCCSLSIFYEVEFPEHAKGGILQDIVEYDYEGLGLGCTTADSEEVARMKCMEAGYDWIREEDEDGTEKTKIWNVVLKTNKGNILLRHVNFSNGCYDGYTVYK